jgi:hypothetical protein
MDRRRRAAQIVRIAGREYEGNMVGHQHPGPDLRIGRRLLGEEVAIERMIRVREKGLAAAVAAPSHMMGASPKRLRARAGPYVEGVGGVSGSRSSVLSLKSAPGVGAERPAVFALLAALALAACDSADRQPRPPAGEQAGVNSAAAPAPSVADPAAPSGPPPGEQAEAAPRGLYVAELRDDLPPLGLVSRGRLEIVDGCLTVLVIGGRATAVFPPGVRRVMAGGRLVAVEYEGRRTPVGPMTEIPGAGVTPDEIRLRQPLPARCPAALWGLGG